MEDVHYSGGLGSTTKNMPSLVSTTLVNVRYFAAKVQSALYPKELLGFAVVETKVFLHRTLCHTEACFAHAWTMVFMSLAT